MAAENGYSVKALSFSPVQGGHGNIEFLAHLEKSIQPSTIAKEELTKVVYQAHEEFKRMNKRERLEVIKDLVVRFPIDTQEEIVDLLKAMVFMPHRQRSLVILRNWALLRYLLRIRAIFMAYQRVVGKRIRHQSY